MPPPLAPPNAARLLIISGLSGAGRSAASNTVEDLGWYVVDNLPPELIPRLYAQASAVGIKKIAVGVDVRVGQFFEALPAMFADFGTQGVSPEVLFLEASDEVIVRRQESVRRPLPLQEGGRLLDGIQAERRKLAALRGVADVVLDTSQLNVHQLAARLAQLFGGEEADAVRLTVLSFGFKNGIPVDADLLFDVRFLPNPHWISELRPLNGLQPEVRDYVLSQEGAQDYVDHVASLLKITVPGYRREGKRFATIAVGCTGGKHRSTAIAETLAAKLREELGLAATVWHRDLGLE